jgi:ATP-dependent Clp protease ATP-binding subunit ClpA
MRQFIEGSDEAYEALRLHATGACARFAGQEMPPDCDPSTADVGFEIDPSTGAAKLLVERDVRYQGASQAVQQWLDNGERAFPTYLQLISWLRGPLREAYQVSANGNGQSSTQSRRDISQLTDVNAVHEGVRGSDRPMYLDQEQLYAQLSERVLGQEHALEGLTGVLARHCARVRPARPAVVFFVGPTGVGKTRTAEEAAPLLRAADDEHNGYQFLRLDMTEYQEAHRVSQLIGSPQGYTGHGEGSQLLDALQANPCTCVLFDEIEKAHPAILRVLMNAMDAGRLSTASRSANGHEVDCRRAVFMFTSNIDAKQILDELDSRGAYGDRAVEDEVCRRRLNAAGIAPEIVGRIGRFLVFRPLSAETRAEIMAMAIAEVALEYGVEVAYIEPDVIINIMDKVRGANFGVRPERFLLDEELGGVFAAVAREGMEGPVRVEGPPYACTPFDGERPERRVPHMMIEPDSPEG